MKQFNVYYSLFGVGCVQVEAKNKAEAEELFSMIDLDEIVKEAEFKGSVEVHLIEEPTKQFGIVNVVATERICTITRFEERDEG